MRLKFVVVISHSLSLCWTKCTRVLGFLTVFINLIFCLLVGCMKQTLKLFTDRLSLPHSVKLKPRIFFPAFFSFSFYETFHFFVTHNYYFHFFFVSIFCAYFSNTILLFHFYIYYIFKQTDSHNIVISLFL